MKVILNSTFPRNTIMPLIAATMLSATAFAHTNKPIQNSTKQEIEYFNKQTFYTADSNKDHALSYTEFISIPNNKQNKENKNKVLPPNNIKLKKEYYIGLLLFSILIAGIDIIKKSINSKK